MDKREVLATIGFYREASPDVRERIAGAAQHVSLETGDRLFREGDVANNIPAVGVGSLRVFRIGATGREITLYHVRSGQASLVSIVSVMLGTPLLATAQAEVPTEAVLLPGSELMDGIRTGEPMRRFISETMARALVDVTRVLEDVAFRPMESRLAALLLEHFAMSEVISMRHEDLASELGTAREVVSRLLEGYERKGAISLSRGRIELRDGTVLRRVV